MKPHSAQLIYSIYQKQIWTACKNPMAKSADFESSDKLVGSALLNLEIDA